MCMCPRSRGPRADRAAERTEKAENQKRREAISIITCMRAFYKHNKYL